MSATRPRILAIPMLLAMLALLTPATLRGAHAQATVGVTLAEFSVSPSAAQVTAGLVAFSATNAGALPHELVVIRTDLAPGALPQAGGSVNEGAVQVVARTAQLAPGTGGALSTNLAAGRYVLICNVPGHYAAGMYAAFAVTPAASPAPSGSSQSANPAPSSGAQSGQAQTQPAPSQPSQSAAGAGAAIAPQSAGVLAPRTGTAGLASTPTSATEVAFSLLATTFVLLAARWLTRHTHPTP